MFACIYIPNASGDTAAALLACASTFSPRVENTDGGTLVFDVEGLERLFGSYSEIALKVAAAVAERGFNANIAVAANADAAICAARGFPGITVLTRGSEAARLRDLPLAMLRPSPDILETLERWGIRTLGAFAKLPAVQVSERLGQESLQHLARTGRIHFGHAWDELSLGSWGCKGSFDRALVGGQILLGDRRAHGRVGIVVEPVDHGVERKVIAQGQVDAEQAIDGVLVLGPVQAMKDGNEGRRRAHASGAARTSARPGAPAGARATGARAGP